MSSFEYFENTEVNGNLDGSNLYILERQADVSHLNQKVAQHCQELTWYTTRSHMSPGLSKSVTSFFAACKSSDRARTFCAISDGKESRTDWI